MSAHGASAVDGSEPLFGLLAEFDTVDGLLEAAEGVRDAGYTQFDAHTPMPVHGLEEAMGIRMSKLPWVVLGGGAFGCCGALLLQWWTNGVNYPFMISGKPLFGLPANIPITFELTVLFAAFGAVIGLIVANGWPQLYHPLFRSPRFRRATDDRFFISIAATDPRFERAKTAALLTSLGAAHVEEVEG
jgi:Alternative complex III, ActD subunit